MSFEARVYIQGVGVYVPQKEEGEIEAKKMLVLFPNHEKAEELGVKDPEGNPVCRHYAVVQFSARCLENRMVQESVPGPEITLAPSCFPDAWTTIDLSGMWLSFTANPLEGNHVETRLTRNGRVPGLLSLPDVLREQIPLKANSEGVAPPPLKASIHPNAKPGDGSERDLLKAGLTLEGGVLSPYAEFEGLYRFKPRDGAPRNGSEGYRRERSPRPRNSCPNPEDQRLSSVLKLELGRVEDFTLHFSPFGAQRPFDLPLHPGSDPAGGQWDELEVWIRHYCELDRPDPDGKTAEPGEEDLDFVLNYTLLEHLDEVLRACANVLPVPQVSTSWAKGGLIGSEARKCMAAQA